VIFLRSLNVLAEAQPAAVIEECRRDNSATQECCRYHVCLAVSRREHSPSFTVWQSSATVVILLSFLVASTEAIGKARADSAEDRNVVGNYRVAVPRSSR
jgi:hypothetical protein